MIRLNDALPDRNSMLIWFKYVRDTDSAIKRKPPGRTGSARILDNVQAQQKVYDRVWRINTGYCKNESDKHCSH